MAEALGAAVSVGLVAIFCALNNAARCVFASCSGMVAEELRAAPRFIFCRESFTAVRGPGDIIAPGDVALDRGRGESTRCSSQHRGHETRKPSVTINGVGPCRSQ